MGKPLQIITIPLAIAIAAGIQFMMAGNQASMAGIIATDDVGMYAQKSFFPRVHHCSCL